MRLMLFSAAVCVLLGTAKADGFTEAELKAAALIKEKAINQAVSNIADLERQRSDLSPSADREKKKQLTEQIVQAKSSLRALRNRAVKSFAEEAKQPKAAAPNRANPKNDLQDRVEEIRRQREANELAQAEAMKGLVVNWPYSTVWVPNKGTAVEFGVCDIRFNGLPPTQGFFRVGDETKAVLVESSDPTVAEPVKDERHINGPYYFRFAKSGVATVTVRLGAYSVAQAIEVKEAPIAVGDQTNIVIEKMGLPSAKPSIYVRWPDAEEHDCFFYKPQAGKPFIGEHWFYRDYPGLVLSITDGRVGQLGTNRKIKDHQIELKMPEPKPE